MKGHSELKVKFTVVKSWQAVHLQLSVSIPYDEDVIVVPVQHNDMAQVHRETLILKYGVYSHSLR